MAFRLSASGAPSEGSRSSGGMFGKMKDRAAAATAAGMAAASSAATKAAKTAKYGVTVAKDAFGSSPSGPGRGGYTAHQEDDFEDEDLQRALAASMAAAETQPEPVKGRVVEEAPPGLQMLVEMGFQEDLAMVALQAAGGDVELALAQLVADRDKSPVTPVHAARTSSKQAAVREAAEKRLAEAQARAGTMDDYRRQQKQQERRPRVPPPSHEEVRVSDGNALDLQAPELEEHLRQAMLQEEMDEELELQAALSASLKPEEPKEMTAACGAVGEATEQEEERAKMSAKLQERLRDGADGPERRSEG